MFGPHHTCAEAKTMPAPRSKRSRTAHTPNLATGCTWSIQFTYRGKTVRKSGRSKSEQLARAKVQRWRSHAIVGLAKSVIRKLEKADATWRPLERADLKRSAEEDAEKAFARAKQLEARKAEQAQTRKAKTP